MAEQQQLAGQQEQQWNPQFDKNQTKNYIKLYKQSPNRFNPQLLESVRQHAQYHNVPFYEGDFSILEAIKQAGAGFIEGFTTLNVAPEHPDNEWEAVSRSIGHLVGFAPGILSGPLGWLGRITNVGKNANKLNALQNASLALRGVRGIPLKIAEDIVLPRAAKIASKTLKNSHLNRIQGFDTFKKYVQKGVVEDIATGAFKLGTASAISSWQHGVDSMIESFFSGAVFGGGFAAIGNAINLKDPKAEMFARGLAGSLWQGIPSTMRGMTTPEQVYEYLMGAYFGGKEKPWTEKRAAKELQKGIKEARKSPKAQFEGTLDPEMFSNWENIPESVRPVLKKMAADWVGQEVWQQGMPGYELAKALKVKGLDKKIGEKPKEEAPIGERKPSITWDKRRKGYSVEKNGVEVGFIKEKPLTKEQEGLYMNAKEKAFAEAKKLGAEIEATEAPTETKIEGLSYAGVGQGSREVFKAEINGKTHFFYRSSSGTAGNYKARIMPFEGYGTHPIHGTNWIIKRMGKRVGSYEEGLSLYPKEVAEAARKLDKKFPEDKTIAKGEDPANKYPRMQSQVDAMKALGFIGGGKKIQPGDSGVHPRYGKFKQHNVNKELGLSKTGTYLNKQQTIEFLENMVSKPPTKTKKISKPVTPQENIKESRRDTFILTSGDKGIQDVVSQEAYKAGLTEVQALFQGQTTSHKTPNTTKVILDQKQLDNANNSISTAIEIINQRVEDTGFGKKIDSSKYGDYYLSVLRRDAAKLDRNYAESVIAIEPINALMNETMGLSRIPVQIAINKGKKVFAFDKSMGWMQYNPKIERFERMSTIPELSRRTAFFGTNTPSDIEVGQIQNLFKVHASKGFKEEVASKVQISEESDKVNTIEYSEAELAQSGIDYKLSSMMQRGLNDVIKEIEPDVVKRYDSIAKIADKAGQLVLGVDSNGRNFLTKGNETNSREWIELIQKEITKFNKDSVMPNHLKRELRQWLVMQNQSYPIYSGGYIAGEGVNIIGPDTPFTRAGQLRKEEGPVKFIEELYLKAAGKDLDTLSKEPVMVGFSDITYKDSTGRLRDVELSRLEIAIAKDVAPKYAKYKDAARAAKDQKKLIIKDIIKRMDKEHDMHLWGGEGDKDKMVFVKYHPNLNKIKLPRFPKDSYDFALNTYGIDKASRDKMTKSIMKYTEDLNNGRDIRLIAGKDGFIKNAIHDNKRNPLWMSNGWRGDKSFWIDPANHGQDLKLTKNGNAKAVIVSSPKELDNLIGVKNSEILQATDGAIIMNTPTGKVTRADKGVPDSGHEKSIAVIPSRDGTKIMKYMKHETTPEGSKMMENYVNPKTGEVGLNYIIYDSSVKQLGNFRESVGDYRINKGKLELSENAEIFEIDPGSFRYNYGVYDSPHSLGFNDAGRNIGNQAPKQMIMMPHSEFKDITQEVVNDYVDTLSGQSYRGTNSANGKVKDYISTKDPKLIEGIIKDFDDIGIKQIEAVLKDRGSEPLAEKLLLEILKTNKRQVENLMGEGESSINDGIQNSRVITEFNGTADNIIKHAAALKDPAVSLIFDKYTKDYVETALNTFVSDRVMKPRIKNSIKARLRPYDKFLEIEKPELNNDAEALKKYGVKADELFFLDNYAEDLPMYARIKGYDNLYGKPLKDVWKAFNTSKVQKNKALKQEFLDVFDAVNIRVPVDAISGAQVLRFGGFTGVKGHGVLMHGRKVELLGGADHDADTAFVFFGGRRQDGSGEGMKKSWIDMFRANKDEFIRGKEESIPLKLPDYPLGFASIGNDGYATKQLESGVTYFKDAYKGLNENYSDIKSIIKKTGKPLWNKTTAWYGPITYNYTGASHKPQKMPKEFYDIARSLENQLGQKEGYFNSALVNIFPKGQKLSRHKDFEDIFQRTDETVGKVATVTLGAKTDISIKKGYDKKAQEEIITTGEGDLYVMPGQKFQKHYTHAVRTAPGERISLTFRHIPKNKLPKNWSIEKGKAEIEDVSKLKMIDPKKEFKDMIVIDKEELQKMGVSESVFDWTHNTKNKFPYLQFTPDIRLFVGQNTAQSRNAMGPVVSMTQNMRAAWHSVRQSPNQTETIETGNMTHRVIKRGKVKIYEPIPEDKQVKFRVSRKALPFNPQQNLYSSALIRFTADPANELGLISFGKMKKNLTSLYFEPAVKEFYEPSLGVWRKLEDLPKQKQDFYKNFLEFQTPLKRKFSSNHMKESRYDLIDNVNKAFFGMDFLNKKKFTYDQKQEMVKKLKDLSDDELSTAMPKVGSMLQDVDFRISIYDKINRDAYYEMMDKQKTIGKTLAKTTDYKKLLDRTVLYRPQSKYIDLTLDPEVNLNNPFMRKKFSEDIPLFLKKLEKHGIKNDGGLFSKIEKTDLPSEALAKINELQRVTEEFLSNSVDEIGSLNSIINEYSAAKKAGVRISESEMLKIAEESEVYKDLSAEQHRRRKKAVYDSDTTDLSRLSEAEAELFKLYFPDARKKPTKLLDQANLDARIVKFKEGLSSDYARNIFDLRLLGSLRSEKTVQALRKYLTSSKSAPKDNLMKDVILSLFKQGTRSSTTKVGYDSNAVDSKNVLKFLKAKNDLFKSIAKEPPKSHQQAIGNLKETKEFKAIQVEKDKDIRTAGTILEKVTGFENLRKPTDSKKLFDSQTKEILELANWLKHEPDFRKEKLNETIMGIYQTIDPEGMSKTLDQLNMSDIKLINNYFRYMKEGTAIQKIEDAVGKYKTAIQKASLKRRNHFQFVEGITEEMMREHLVFLPTQGYFKTKDGSVSDKNFTEVLKPTYYGEVLMNWASRSAEQAAGKVTEINNKFINDLKFLNQVEEQGVNPLGMYQLAISRYELQTRDRRNLEKDWYQMNWDQLKAHWGWNKIRLKDFNIDFGDGKGRVSTTGAKIVDKIQRLHEGTYDFLLEIQKGKPEALKKYHIPGAYWGGDKSQPKLDWKRFRKDLIDDYNNNRLINLDIGGDGIRHMLKSYMAENMPVTEYMRDFKVKGKTVTKKISKKEWLKLSKKDRKQWTADSDINFQKLEKWKIYDTQKRIGYYPHLFNSKSEAIKGRVEEVAELQKRYKRGEITEEAYLSEWASLENKYARMLGDYNFREYEMTDIIDMSLFPELKQTLSEAEMKRRDMSLLPSVTTQPGHAQARESHTPGWIIDPAVNTMYIKNTVDSLYRQISNFMTRDTLNTMKDHMYKKWVIKAKNEKDREDGKELVNNWLTFWHNYAREAQGMPSVVTTEMWNNPKLYYSNTPAGWFADNIISNRLNKIADKLGLTDKELPEGMKGSKAVHMQKWSQVEARFQLATLMTHPKTPINNIFGGSLHTYQSVGYEPMKKARDYDYLQTINPKWRTRKDVYDSMDKLGIQSELLRHEYGFDKNFQNTKNKEFMDTLSEKIKGDKEISKDMIVSVAKERGISDRIVDIAGKYMSIPERMLRTDAFLSHYIRNWERFGGAIKDPEHPFLIEMAKKGVKATQFLYNAPNRPAIARSGLGKVMTRFQLWSWNAVRFRNDIRKQARIYGYKPGSEGMKRFERMMTVDMMTLALGSLFMYSLFGQIVPAPWNWLQDTAEWVFGDEEQRNRAFFGMYPTKIAPLQIITPPILRFPISAIRQFAEDDYNKLADYYIYTMFPFGRQIRDFAHPDSNIIENPMRAPEKLLGIPLTGMAKEAKRRKKEPKFESSVPGLSMY